MAKGQSNKYSLGRSKEDKYDFLLSVIGTSFPQQKNKKKTHKRYSESLLARLVGNVQDHGSIALVSALFQIALGSLVIALALLQAIRPVWLAGIVTVLGSFSILLGIYVAYYSWSNQYQAKKLIDEAIERVVKQQN
tara:strand:- start:11683 stop:12090 length:408 start_codon:yes stop_codon:yes gene_type:complete